MRISIIAIGKFENSPHKEVFKHYLKRLKWKVELKEFELKNANNLTAQKIKEAEANLILKAVNPSSKLILLDENGQEFTSKNFAKFISNCALQGNSNLTFIIGGANGLDETLLNKSYQKMTLGKLTLPHLMVRSILIEQLYRAQTIIDGHPYHRE